MTDSTTTTRVTAAAAKGAPGPGSSRQDALRGGWRREGEARGSYVALLARRHRPNRKRFYWLSSDALLKSRNDVFAHRIHDLVDDERARWIAAARAAGLDQRFPDFVIDRSELTAPAFLVVGDPGEGDAS